MSRTYRRIGICLGWGRSNVYKYVWDTFSPKDSNHYREEKKQQRRSIRRFQQHCVKRYGEYVPHTKSKWYW